MREYRGIVVDLFPGSGTDIRVLLRQGHASPGRNPSGKPEAQKPESLTRREKDISFMGGSGSNCDTDGQALISDFQAKADALHPQVAIAESEGRLSHGYLLGVASHLDRTVDGGNFGGVGCAGHASHVEGIIADITSKPVGEVIADSAIVFRDEGESASGMIALIAR